LLFFGLITVMGKPNRFPWFLDNLITVKLLNQFPHTIREIVEVIIGNIQNKPVYTVQIFIRKFYTRVAQCAVQQFSIQFQVLIALFEVLISYSDLQALCKVYNHGIAENLHLSSNFVPKGSLSRIVMTKNFEQ